MRLMGGPYVLITFQYVEMMEELLLEGRHWLDFWFSKFQKWCKNFINPCRFAWIRCEGVPIHVWKSTTFNNIWSFVG